jgi:hypothetical protein
VSNVFERVTVDDGKEVVLVWQPAVFDGTFHGRVVDQHGSDRYRYLSIAKDRVTKRQLLRWNADGLLVDTDREPAACGECVDPDEMGWHLSHWEGDAPVIVCRKHSALAPGWAYHDDSIGRMA